MTGIPPGSTLRFLIVRVYANCMMRLGAHGNVRDLTACAPTKRSYTRALRSRAHIRLEL